MEMNTASHKCAPNVLIAEHTAVGTYQGRLVREIAPLLHLLDHVSVGRPTPAVVQLVGHETEDNMGSLLTLAEI